MVAYNLEEPLQSAYKLHHSTETALLKVQNDILIAIDNYKCVALLLLDLSAAFDTVDRELLFQRMIKRFGIDGQVLKWFRSYRNGRTQSVIIDNIKSTSKDLCCGVPQGSVLGPNSTIQPSTSAYNIGVTFDEYMSMNKHITNICKSCFFHLRKIARIKDYIYQHQIFKH